MRSFSIYNFRKKNFYMVKTCPYVYNNIKKAFNYSDEEPD